MMIVEGGSMCRYFPAAARPTDFPLDLCSLRPAHPGERLPVASVSRHGRVPITSSVTVRRLIVGAFHGQMLHFRRPCAVFLAAKRCIFGGQMLHFP